MSCGITFLKYVGDGAFRAGFPARDIDGAEIHTLPPEEVQAAIDSGLYVATREDEQPAAEEAAVPDPDKVKKDELIALAEERGLDTSGTKAEIADRIAAFEDQQSAATEQPAAEEATAADQGEPS